MWARCASSLVTGGALGFIGLRWFDVTSSHCSTRTERAKGDGDITKYKLALQQLHAHGMTVLPSAVCNSDTTKTLLQWLEISATSAPSEHSYGIPVARESTRGRTHTVLTKMHASYTRKQARASGAEAGALTGLHEAIDTVLTELEPLATEFFHTTSSSFVVTQIQLLDSAVGSVDQFWHVDNVSRGLTVVVPLLPVTLEHGPTQLLAGSHRLFTWEGNIDFNWLGNTLRCLVTHAVTRSATDVVAATHGPLVQSSALVFDSRTLHRGLANSSLRHRPVLIVRYDEVHHPPPGVGILGTLLLKLFGSWLSANCSTRVTWDQTVE